MSHEERSYSMMPKRCFTLLAAVVATLLGRGLTLAQTEHTETVRERLWIRGHPVGVYNDFAERRPLPVELMRHQTEAGYRWLKEGRVPGLIFLATLNVDVDLDAVAWTRQWIAQVGDEPSPRNSTR
jgi:hypothetical protein